MAISTNPKPTIYRNLHENTGTGLHVYHLYPRYVLQVYGFEPEPYENGTQPEGIANYSPDHIGITCEGEVRAH